MKSEILSQEKNVVVVKAEYEAGEVDGAVGKTVRELSKSSNIKGFRKGHVPRRTLELMVGKNAIYRKTLEDLTSEALENVVSEYDLDLVIDPKFKPGDLSEGKPLELEFTFEVRPEVELPDISALSAEKTVFIVSDEDVEKGLRQLLESNARLEPVDDDRPAGRDDIIDARYSSFAALPGGKLKELDRDRKNTLFIANLRSDIADAIIGHKPAEELEFDIKLEDDYPDSRMAGKTVRYELEILNFVKRVVPEADDANISDISRGKYDSVDALKAEIRRQLEQNASERSEASLHESAIKSLAAASVVDVPESMVDREYVVMRNERNAVLERDVKHSLDEYLENNDLSVKDFDGSLRKRAEEIVRNTLVLNALADRDEISFTRDDLNEEIMRVAGIMRMNPQEYADALSNDKREFTAFASRVRTKNAVKHLASLVRVTEIPEEKHDGRREDANGEHDDAGGEAI